MATIDVSQTILQGELALADLAKPTGGDTQLLADLQNLTTDLASGKAVGNASFANYPSIARILQNGGEIRVRYFDTATPPINAPMVDVFVSRTDPTPTAYLPARPINLTAPQPTPQVAAADGSMGNNP